MGACSKRCLLIFTVIGLAVAIDKATLGYCFDGSNPAKGVTIPALPQGYELASVQVMIRHGARVPIWATKYDMWPCKKSNIVDYSLTHNKVHSKKERLFRLQRVRKGNKMTNDCFYGQLTSLGIAQGTAVGAGLREAYVTRTKFLSPVMNNSEVKFRATDSMRVQQTAEALIRSLFPSVSDKENVVDIGVREKMKEDMRPNKFTCPRISSDWKSMYHTRQGENHLMAANKALLALGMAFSVNKTSKQVKKQVSAYPISMTFPAWIRQFDSLKVMECHNKSFSPKLITPAVMHHIEVLSEWSWGSLYNSDFSIKTMGPFVTGTLAKNFADLVENKQQAANQIKFRLFAAHDISLAPVLGMFGIYDNLQPPLASQVIFELLKKTKIGGENGAKKSKVSYFIRVMYNGKVMKLPACSHQLCTWQEWTSLIAQFSVETTRLRSDCNTVMSSHALVAHLKKELVYWKAGTVIGAVACVSLLVLMYWRCSLCYSRSVKKEESDYITVGDPTEREE